ncbi:unnamed protein product [Coregonus sp. 'balchen']|nr:unnamed protein product [Coregonus sp. 'balchen']
MSNIQCQSPLEASRAPSASAARRRQRQVDREELTSLCLLIVATSLEAEKKESVKEKDNFMAQIPGLDLSGDQAALVEMIKKLAQTIDKVDEERYDTEAKVKKSDKEIEELKMKVVEVQGIKKPALKYVC